MVRDRLDPVDLMMLGRMDEATKMYLDSYVEAAKEGDRYIAPLMLSQLHFCVAGKEATTQKAGRAPEDFTDEVERLVMFELRERGIKMDARVVKEDIAMAKNSIVEDRKHAERESHKWV